MALATTPSSGESRKEKNQKQPSVYVVLVLRFDNGGRLLWKPGGHNLDLSSDRHEITNNPGRETERDRGQVLCLCMGVRSATRMCTV